MEVKIQVGFRRSTPLSPEEVDAVHRMSHYCLRLQWPGLSPVEIHALDGDGDWRAALSTIRYSPDPGMVVLPLLAARITELWKRIPGAQMVIDDPTRMLSLEGDRLAFGGWDGNSDDTLPRIWPSPGSVIPLPSSWAEDGSPNRNQPAEQLHPDLIPQLEALGSNLLQAVDQRERAQGIQDSPGDSVEEIVLTEAPDAIPSDLLDQAIQSLYLDSLSPTLSTLPPNLRFRKMVQEQIDGRPRAATATALLLAYGIWNPEQVPGLIHRLSAIAHRDTLPWPLRALSVQAILRTRRPDAPALIRSLAGSSTVQVARAAVRALGWLVDGESRSLLRSKARIPALSAHAIAAMADTGDPVGCDIAEDLAQDPRDEVRLSVAHHLPRLGGSRAVPILQKMQSDTSIRVRSEVTASLASVCGADDLAGLLRVEDTEQVVAALHGIGRSDRCSAGELVLRASADPRAAVREAALETLGNLGLPCATPALLNCLDDSESDVTLAAIQALARCGDRRSRRPLEQMALRTGPVGAAAAHALRAGALQDRAAPSSDVRVHGWRLQRFSDEEASCIRTRLAPLGLRLDIGDGAFLAQGKIQPRALSRLESLVLAIQQLDLDVIALKWDISDAQELIRRASEGWVLSAHRGQPVREVGAPEIQVQTQVPISAPAEAPPPAISVEAAEPVAEPETEVHLDGLDEVEDKPTEVLTEAPPVRARTYSTIAVGSDDDHPPDEEELESESYNQGIVLSIGATTSLEDDVGGIIEVQAAQPQAEEDPGFREPELTERNKGTAFVYIEPESDSETDTYQIHRPSPSLIQSYSLHAPMDDQVDVFEASPQEYSSSIQADEPPPSPWKRLLSGDRADEFLMDLVWSGLTDQDRERLAAWLRSDDPGKVEAACRVIAATGEATDSTGLKIALAHNEAAPRVAAAHALGTVGGEHAFDLLQRALGDDNPEVQESIQTALALLGPTPSE